MPDPNKKKKSSVEGSGKQLVGPTLYGTPENAIAKAAREQYGYAPPVGPGWSAYANQYVGAGGMIPYMSAGYNPYAYFAQPGTRFHPELFNPNQTLPPYPTQSSSPGAFSAYYAPAGVAGDEGQGAGSQYTQGQWQPGPYWSENNPNYNQFGQLYGLTWNREQQGWNLPYVGQDEKLHDTMNRFGQPVGTIAPYGQSGSSGPGSKANAPTYSGRGKFFGATNRYRGSNRQPEQTSTGTGIEGGWFGQLANWRV